MIPNFPAMFAAAQDWASDVPLEEGKRLYILAKLGQRPNADDPANPRAGRANDAIAERSRIEDYQADQRLAGAELSPLHWALGPAVLLSFAIEFAGAFDLLQAMELDIFSHVLLSLAVTFAVFSASWFAANSMQSTGTSGSSSRYRRFGFLALGLYVLVVGACAAMRLDVLSNHEDSSSSSDWPAAILMAAATLAPAAVAKVLLPQWVSSRGVRTRYADSKRQIRVATSGVKSAEKYLDRAYQARATWDARAERLGALYEQAYRRQGASQSDDA